MKMNFPKATMSQRAQGLFAAAKARVDAWFAKQAESDVFQRRVDVITGANRLSHYY